MHPPGATRPPLPRRTLALLLGIVLLAALVRFPALDRVPPALYWDETSIGCEARSIALTGHDLNGRTLPLLVQALNDWKHPLYVWSAAVTTGLLGLDGVAVRLPAAIFGTATVLLLLLLAREVEPDAPCVPPLAALALALMPWHVVYSRMAWEAITYAFAFVLSAWLFLRALRLPGRGRFALAGAAAGLVAYTYTPAKLVSPALLAVEAALVVHAARRARPASGPCPRAFDALAVVLPGLAVALPIGVFALLHWEEANARFRLVSFLGAPSPAAALVRSYLAHLSPFFLFVGGDGNARHTVPGVGLSSAVLAPLVVLGLVRTLGRRDRARPLLVAWLVLYPVGGAVTVDAIPHATRAILAAPLLALLAARGAAELGSRVSRPRLVAGVVALALLSEGARFVEAYARRYPSWSAAAWGVGRKEAIVTAQDALARGGVRQVLVSGRAALREDVLFHTGFDPRGFDPRAWDPRWRWVREEDLAAALAGSGRDTLLIAWEDEVAEAPDLVPRRLASGPSIAIFRGRR